MSETEGLQKIRSRRSHRKSRLGCGNCKKRRIKCDEKKPACSNCLHHAVDCDFSMRSGSEASTPPARRYQFRQSKYQPVGSPQDQDQDQDQEHDEPAAPTSTSASTSKSGISLADLHLFHHFTTTTAFTLADATSQPKTRHLWQCLIPSWGICFPSILHLILTLSALHLASLQHTREENPAEKAKEQQKYTTQADAHFTFGVRSVTSVLALDTLDSGNCQQIYISAVLICFAYFARGPRTGEFLVFSAAGKSEWLVLLQGVRAILAQRQAEIFRGPLEPESKGSGSSASEGRGLELDAELARHVERLHEVRALVVSEVVDAGDRECYLATVDDLVDCFRGAYASRKAGEYGTELMPFTMGWTFRLADVMIERLEAREPAALVVLAHWAILVRFMREDVWFMKGWDAHIVRGIAGCLPEGFRGWVEWPEFVISN
ncbi:hypothetical protein BJY01DRAFT_262310 [Aspergillus pseudoustus]|uniref:Zn(2)-C6 fungal-type domain-containing protein n=1 Tax=Aspergillus pseudoustus TaxID=1810923 RepID=A0ABR4IFM5_9EURO